MSHQTKMPTQYTAIMDSIARQKGRRKVRGASVGRRAFTIRLNPPAAQACEKLKEWLGLSADRAAVEIALLWTEQPEHVDALRRLLATKGLR